MVDLTAQRTSIVLVLMNGSVWFHQWFKDTKYLKYFCHFGYNVIGHHLFLFCHEAHACMDEILFNFNSFDIHWPNFWVKTFLFLFKVPFKTFCCMCLPMGSEIFLALAYTFCLPLLLRMTAFLYTGLLICSAPDWPCIFLFEVWVIVSRLSLINCLRFFLFPNFLVVIDRE